MHFDGQKERAATTTEIGKLQLFHHPRTSIFYNSPLIWSTTFSTWASTCLKAAKMFCLARSSSSFFPAIAPLRLSILLNLSDSFLIQASISSTEDDKYLVMILM
ncbi:BQ5605_C009g05634 [Microbotryum silenes-dioicae]|uniref:BQ5605_C009g05634 protein n=1 Tax=Microbotryum silenes-dioicae TaxID=796604 RepID=A0A2X0ME01_9BASI|nr:BQ5605_C009g05634 [Microbotryum silenes-dioicae]